MSSRSYQSIALLGTSADPPTTGHKALLIGLTKLFPKVVTWASNNPTKKHREPLEKRHELLNALVDSINIPNLELKQELSSRWAIKTVDKALKYWPKSTLILIIGSDLISDIPKWHESNQLLLRAQLGIVPRQGWDLDNQRLKVINRMGGIIHLLPLNIPASASSNIRNKPILSQIPEAILPMLLKENLYGITNTTQ
ncbi:nicotinate-nucleotide adenylyltransferase [Prochlorococcus marinus]|uniref:nicotinate-nucleotide adenylyltransferase n=1 Tax=Prochlorococcus marinus TaxID=1219 RepID=UPI0022B34C62|nr:nicotinate-nucleotide adenylyltransferase [Prochlorococcus marinus]